MPGRPPDPPAASSLPHRGPALLVRDVCRVDGERIVCAGTVPADSALVDGDRAASLVALELAAQAAGLLDAFSTAGAAGGTNPEDAAPVGYLARFRKVRLSRPSFRAGERLTAEVRRLSAIEDLAVFSCRVSGAEGDILHGEFTTCADRRPRST